MYGVFILFLMSAYVRFCLDFANFSTQIELYTSILRTFQLKWYLFDYEMADLVVFWLIRREGIFGCMPGGVGRCLEGGHFVYMPDGVGRCREGVCKSVCTTVCPGKDNPLPKLYIFL